MRNEIYETLKSNFGAAAMVVLYINGTQRDCILKAVFYDTPYF